MDRSELAYIEEGLDLLLPAAYRDALCATSGADPDYEPYFDQDATEIVIANLELRMCPGKDVFAGKPWPADEICIGRDGCGNYYSISANDPHAAVRVFDHEANEFEVVAETLDGFFAHVSAILDRVGARAKPVSQKQPRRALLKQDEAILARTAIPRHSILDPISFQEWASFVDDDADLTMRGYRAATNPFTKEETRFDAPGLAVLPTANSLQEFMFVYGRVVVRRPGLESLAKLNQAASALHAIVHTGWQLETH